MSGIEWVVDASGCSPQSLTDLESTRQLFDEIIRALKLHPVGETQWHQFPGARGITGLCLLAESHLTCHTFPEHGSLCLNVFCCVPRSEFDFRGILERLFGAQSVTVRQLARNYETPRRMAADD